MRTMFVSWKVKITLNNNANLQEAAYIVSGSAAAVMQMSDRVQVRLLTLQP